MTSPQKRKGDVFEREVVAVLQKYFPEARRTRAGHAEDWGDIANIPKFVVQAKNYANVTTGLREAVDSSITQSVRSPFAQWGVAVVKRPRVPTDYAYAAMPLWQFGQLAKRIDYLERRLALYETPTERQSNE